MVSRVLEFGVSDDEAFAVVQVRRRDQGAGGLVGAALSEDVL
jgi:hypothetical protein